VGSSFAGRARHLATKPLLATVLLSALACATASFASPPASPLSFPWESAPFSAPGDVMLRAAATLPVPLQDEPVEVLLSSASYSYDAAGRETYTHHIVYRILASSADESWSTVEEHWSPWHQAKPEVRARVISPDGVVHPLEPSVLTEEGEAEEGPDMFGDGRVIRGPLPATGPGALVEQEVIVRDTAPFYDHGIVQTHNVGMGVTVLHSQLRLEAPTSTPLRWVVRLLPADAPREETRGDRHIVSFDFRDVRPLEDPEPGLPPTTARSSYVAFSTGVSWADIAHHYSAVVDETIHGADLAAFLRSAKATDTNASQLDLMNRVLDRLAEIRYTGVELGKGGIVPRTPAETLHRKFGDCKDKSVLLIAALRALDIPAYIALLDAADDEPDVEATLPGFGNFNHAIVVVPGTPPIWIDPTDRFARAGELPAEDQGRLALVASPTATGLTTTPESTPEENSSIKTREIFLSEMGPARAVETVVYSGDSERNVRAIYANEEPEEMRQSLLEYAKKTFRAKDLTSYERSDPFDLGHPFRVRIEAKEASRGFTDERTAVLAIAPMSLLEALPAELIPAGPDRDRRRGSRSGESETARAGEYYFTHPFHVEASYRIVPPPGFAPQPLPPSRMQKLGSVTLSQDYSQSSDGVVTAVLRLDTGRRLLTAHEFEQVRTALRDLGEAKPTFIRYEQVGELHLAAGRIREALTEFQRQAASEPRKALPHSRMARALLAGGLGEAARREAERAVHLEPGSALAERTLGTVLEHDAVGRHFGPGFDRAGALAAYRQAKQLDPEDAVARGDLAILLEHDAHGRRYAPGADLSAAIDEYRQLRTELKRNSLDDNLLIALLWAGRFTELRDLVAGLEESSLRLELGVAATAALDGPQAAITESERRISTSEARVTALTNAGRRLIALRRYAEAAELLNRAGQESPDAAALLAQAEAIRRVRRREDLPPNQNDPAGVVARFLFTMSDEPADLKPLLPYLSHELRQRLRDDSLRTKLLGMAGTRAAINRIAGPQTMPLSTLVEIGLGAMQQVVTGTDPLGYRVEITTPPSHARQVFFLMPEDGALRIAGLSGAPDTLASEALALIDRHSLEAAHQWLEWAHDLLASDGGSADGFALLWEEGNDGTAASLRCMAAALLAGRDSERAVPILLGCREPEASEVHKIAIDLALSASYQQLGRTPDLLAAVARVVEARPGTPQTLHLALSVYPSANRWEDLKAAAQRRLSASPDDPQALAAIARADQGEGDLDGARTIVRKLADGGKASGADLNLLAWLALVRGEADDDAIAIAQRANAALGYTAPNALHTLAALYAEAGKTAEAYKVIIQAIEARDDRTPNAADWYVLARLAERYGETDEARRLYARVEPSRNEIPAISTHHLAAVRLAAMRAAGGDVRARH
jgi:tetratricopeptide (TPR) repeat protein